MVLTEDEEFLISASKDRNIIVHSVSTNKKEYQIVNAHGGILY
jgi:hypothetical protein